MPRTYNGRELSSNLNWNSSWSQESKYLYSCFPTKEAQGLTHWQQGWHSFRLQLGILQNSLETVGLWMERMSTTELCVKMARWQHGERPPDVQKRFRWLWTCLNLHAFFFFPPLAVFFMIIGLRYWVVDQWLLFLNQWKVKSQCL